MSSRLKTVPVYLLAATVLLGSFSRLTHGIYTPKWYAFQEYHAPDDGSTIALITPYIDAAVGLTLLLGTRKLRLSAAVFSVLVFTMGLAMQVVAGKEYIADVALVGVAGGAVWGVLRR
ncbi:hypothetical protein BDW59DRAFT_147798 [Aspergillus cavernicola]|uniref:DoxX family protein n=1 Tax=Aspergillus cavernicola TaxID=176166 RepID=A0ABR4I989_9EURO